VNDPDKGRPTTGGLSSSVGRVGLAAGAASNVPRLGAPIESLRLRLKYDGIESILATTANGRGRHFVSLPGNVEER
jgi:hypothetical protein